MWSALFSWAAETPGGVLILQPDTSAQARVAGFKGGAELRLTTDASNKTVTSLLDKLNKYRGPDQQITRVWRITGEEIIGSLDVVGELRAIVRSDSVAA